MRQSGAGAGLAADHPGDLADALRAGHRMDLAAGAAVRADRLADHQMGVGAGGDLGQMGDRQHLAVLSELAHQPPDGVADRAADAGVDLVEDQRACAQAACLTAAAGGDGDGQRQPREFAAGGDLGQRPRRAAGVAGDQELDRLQAMRLRLGQRLQRDREASAGHAELLHRGGHRLGQAGRGRLPARRDLARLRDEGRPRGLGLALQRLEIGGGIQLGQLGLPLRQLRGQIRRRAAEAPRQPDPGRQARIQLGQALGLEFGAAQQRLQAARGIGQLHLRAGQHLDDLGQRRLVAGHRLQRLERACGLAAGRRFAFMDCIDRQLHRIQDGLRMGQALVLCVEFGPFVRARRQTLDLADLPDQALALAFALGAQALGGLQPCELLAPALPGQQHRAGVDLGMVVEPLAHRRRPGQALPGVLAVNVDQMLGRLAQLRDGGGAAVDPRAALALRVDRAAQQQRRRTGLVGCGQSGLVEPGGQRRRHRLELGGDLGAALALADHAGVAPAAQHDLQRVDQDGLARARLSGQHREAGAEVDVETADDDEVAQGQPAQHHWPPSPGSAPSFQCSLRRSVA